MGSTYGSSNLGRVQTYLTTLFGPVEDPADVAAGPRLGRGSMQGKQEKLDFCIEEAGLLRAFLNRLSIILAFSLFSCLVVCK